MNKHYLNTIFHKVWIVISLLIFNETNSQSRIETKDSALDLIDSIESTMGSLTKKENYEKSIQLLKIARKARLYEIEIESYRKIAYYHYLKRNKDSTLFYNERFEELVTKKADSISDELIVRGYAFNAYTMHAFYGYNEYVTENYSRVYQLATEKNISRYEIYVRIKLAEIEMNKGENDKALNMLLKLSEENGENLPYAGNIYGNIAKIYQIKRDFDSSLKWLTKPYRLKSKSFHHWINQTDLSYHYYQLGDFDKALKIISNTNKNTLNYKKYVEYTAGNSYYQALYYYGLEDLKKAIWHMKQAVFSSLRVEDRIIYQGELAKYYKELGNYELANTIERQRINSIEELYEDRKNLMSNYFDSKIKEQEAKQDKEIVLLENEVLVGQNKTKNAQLFGLLAIISVGLLFLLIYFLFRKNKQSDKTISQLKKNEKRYFEEILRLRENELSANIMAMSDRVGVLKELQEQLKKTKNKKIDYEQVSNTLENLINSASDIGEVSTRLESQYPGIVHQLKILHPDLSAQQIRYCLLTKLDLSIKETANILQVAPDTVKVSRSRIKKKMNIPNEMSFKSYLDQISER